MYQKRRTRQNQQQQQQQQQQHRQSNGNDFRLHLTDSQLHVVPTHKKQSRRLSHDSDATPLEEKDGLTPLSPPKLKLQTPSEESQLPELPNIDSMTQ